MLLGNNGVATPAIDSQIRPIPHAGAELNVLTFVIVEPPVCPVIVFVVTVVALTLLALTVTATTVEEFTFAEFIVPVFIVVDWIVAIVAEVAFTVFPLRVPALTVVAFTVVIFPNVDPSSVELTNNERRIVISPVVDRIVPSTSNSTDGIFPIPMYLLDVSP